MEELERRVSSRDTIESSLRGFSVLNSKSCRFQFQFHGGFVLLMEGFGEMKA